MSEIPVSTGEEGENTVFQVRTKLYVLTQDTSSNQYIYKERGIGVLKLNVSKESRARLVMRTDGAFRLILNVALSTVEYQSLDPKSIRISAMEEEKNTQTLRSFALRFPRLDEKQETLDALEKYKKIDKGGKSENTTLQTHEEKQKINHIEPPLPKEFKTNSASK